nr:putative disease resistance protein RGA4 [Quercus suber]
MVSWNYFLLVYPDHPEPGLTSLDLDPPLYKLRFDWINIDLFTMDHEFVRHCLFDGLVSEKARHASVGRCSISEGWLQPSRGLRTIFLRRRGTHCYSNSLLNDAGRLFLKVRYLRILDLSHAGFKSLPDYVCDLLHLRSLNLSYNPIKTLSRSIITLFRLQTLNLFRCHELTSIPDNLYLLSNLRHLVISPVKLNLMSTFIGRLTSLQTLLQFTVLRKDGCQIGEPRNLNNLRGELSIENLENVATLDEAKGASPLKTGIHKESLVWSKNEPNANFDIAQGLRPHCNLKVLKIFNYNSKFPSWVSNPSFTHLISITLTNCLIEELPPLGPLPLLKSLQIVNVNGLNILAPSSTDGELSKLLSHLYLHWKFGI